MQLAGLRMRERKQIDNYGLIYITRQDETSLLFCPEKGAWLIGFLKGGALSDDVFPGIGTGTGITTGGDAGDCAGEGTCAGATCFGGVGLEEGDLDDPRVSPDLGICAICSFSI